MNRFSFLNYDSFILNQLSDNLFLEELSYNLVNSFFLPN